MAEPVDFIFCGKDHSHCLDIAMRSGFLYGRQLPYGEKTKYPMYFADQNWKKPNRLLYMKSLEFHRPHMATVLDLERRDQREEVLDWAASAAQFVNVVIIIPKVSLIHTLPKQIGSAEVRLGYSVPTKYGGTEILTSEFLGWPVHLLGGNPAQQKKLMHYMNVRSADGNMLLKLARGGKIWMPGKGIFTSNPVQFTVAYGKRWNGETSMMEEVFRQSCDNMMHYFHEYRRGGSCQSQNLV